MSYTLDVIPLTEGLDFNTATSLAKPGSLRDCLNYEFVDGAGLKRIDGMRLYDGNNRHKLDKIFFILVNALGVIDMTDAIYAQKPWLYVDSPDNPNKIPFGYMAWDSDDIPQYDTPGGATVIDKALFPFIRLDCPSYADPSFCSGDIKILNSSVLTIPEGDYEIISPTDLSSVQLNAIYFTTTGNAVDEESQLLANVQATGYVSSDSFISIVAGEEDQAPTPVNVIWAEKIKDTTYEIGDCFVASGTSTRQIYPGDYVFVKAVDNFPYLVLSASNSGSWAGGTATLHLVPLNTTSVTESHTRSGDALFSYDEYENTISLYRDISVISATTAAITDAVFTKPNALSDIDSQPEIACMWKVDNEVGALTAADVFSVAEPGTEGTLYNLSLDTVTTTGDAEGMPLITGGAVKAVLPTKRGSGYTSAPSFTINHVTAGTAASSPVASLANTINRTNWQFVHTGWTVPFREGSRKYGYLNKIDRYKDIDGSTYSASSSLTGLEATRYAGGITGAAAGITTWPQPNATGSRWSNHGVWYNQADTDDPATLLGNVNAADTTQYVYQRLSVTGTSVTTSRAFILSGFSGLDIPEGSSIKGIKVSAVVIGAGDTTTIPTDLKLLGVLGVVGYNETENYVEKAFGEATEFLTAGGANLRTEMVGGMTATTFTAGGTNSLFGAGVIPIEDILNPKFSIGLFLRTDATAATALEVRIDHVFIDVYYELPSVRLYFKSNATSHSGGDIITIHGDLVDYTVSSGSLEVGDAEGVLTVVNLRTITANTSAPAGLTLGNSAVPYYTVLDDMDIYLDSGLTVKLGEVSATMSFNGFDSYKTIKQNASRYTSVRANFFANDEYESHFICSGAGRAGIWDSKYWSRIYAINPKQENAATLDKPRHVGVHNFHLMLGYASGSVLFSTPGEPSNFSAFDGAGEIGIGDKINGFNRLQGNAFGVFCEESVHAITGSDVGNFASQIIVPNEGALEYSVASFGNRVIFTSRTGITTLDQSEKYGNFTGRKLSFDVNPWLIPRISSGAGMFTQITDFNPVFEAGNGYVCAYANPHNNQYRLWFKDGLQLWMTLVSEDAPKFTFVQYFASPRADLSLYACPVFPNYVSSAASNTDSNKTLFCPDREFVLAITKSNGGLGTIVAQIEALLPGIYSLDVGDSFDGGPTLITTPPDLSDLDMSRSREAIPHYALINYQYLKNPFVTKTLRKVRLEGQTRGAAPLAVYAEDAYKASVQEVRTTGTNISLPRTPLDEIRLSYKPESTLANVAATGRVLSILIVGESLANDAYFTTTGTESLTSTRTTVPTPSHYLQALLVQFSEEGTEDA